MSKYFRYCHLRTVYLNHTQRAVIKHNLPVIVNMIYIIDFILINEINQFVNQFKKGKL